MFSYLFSVLATFHSRTTTSLRNAGLMYLCARCGTRSLTTRRTRIWREPHEEYWLKFHFPTDPPRDSGRKTRTKHNYLYLLHYTNASWKKIMATV